MKLTPSRRLKTGLLLSVTVLAGAIGGGVAFALQPDSAAPSDEKSYEAGTNDAGLTYGSLADVTEVGNEPDLVLVIADNGSEGYVYADQLDVPDFASPEEAGAWSKEQANTTVQIPVYELDGKTKIGTFTIGGE